MAYAPDSLPANTYRIFGEGTEWDLRSFTQWLVKLSVQMISGWLGRKNIPFGNSAGKNLCVEITCSYLI